MKKIESVLIWVLVKVTCILLTVLFALLVCTMWWGGYYSLSAIFTVFWFMSVVFITIKEGQERDKRNGQK